MRYIQIFTIIVSLSFITLAGQAQQKDVYQVVPFLKGKKWGLVYPDGQEFYPAMFDTIHIQNRGRIFSVFGKEKGRERAVVKKDRKLMWLLPNKKLVDIPKPERPPGDVTDAPVEELMEAKIGTIQQEGILDGSRQITVYARNGNAVEVKNTTSGYSFYRNGIHQPELDADFYTTETCEMNRCRFLILTKKGLQALVDLETLQFFIPFKYQEILSNINVEDWRIVKKDGLTGIVDIHDKEIIPVKYQALYPNYTAKPVWKSPFVVKQGNKMFFYHYSPAHSWESDKKYDELYYASHLYNKPTILIYFAKSGGKMGVVTNTDSVIAPFKYDYAGFGDDNRIVFLYTDKKMGFHNLRTNYRKEPVYENFIANYNWGNPDKETDYFILHVRKGDKIFFIDQNGKEFISK